MQAANNAVHDAALAARTLLMCWMSPPLWPSVHTGWEGCRLGLSCVCYRHSGLEFRCFISFSNAPVPYALGKTWAGTGIDKCLHWTGLFLGSCSHGSHVFVHSLHLHCPTLPCPYSCQAQIMFRDSMSGRVWKTGSVQVSLQANCNGWGCLGP